ncbi:MAG TPA: FtsW/RodA/SpoVE family cell cycle protein, partial [Armatimonadota bacterium]
MEKRSPDLILFILTVALVGIGCLMVFNASYAVAGQVYHNPEYFAVRQMMFAVVGIAFMFVAMNFPYW